MRRHPAVVARVRRAVRSALTGWNAVDLVEDMELIVSELVGNAVRHGGGEDVGVLLLARDGRVLLEVADGTCGRPVERRPGEDDENGRGLLIVRALAEDCGWRDDDRGGTTVWASMSLPARARRREAEVRP